MNATQATSPQRRQLAIRVATDPAMSRIACSTHRSMSKPMRPRMDPTWFQLARAQDVLRPTFGAVIVHLLASIVIGVLFVGMLIQSASAADIAPQPTLTTDGAKSVAAFALAAAKEKKAPGAAIAIVDAAGNLLYLERLDGTFAASPTVSTGKARTAIYFKKPTRVFEDIVNKGRYAMLSVPEVAPFTPLMGGVPLEVNGYVVGAIGVSGAASAQQDDEIATAAAEQFARTHQTLSSVQHVPHATVADGFRHDTNLVATEGFRVNASRRDGPGEAEVHLADTDIFYVLDGSATFVTGGEVVDARNTAANEVRGSALRNGEERQLVKGDVITIPRGVPHWFKQVKTPFTYYVVKTTG